MPNLTVLCDQGKHCPGCREAGRAGDDWRAGIAAHYRVPEGWPGVAGCQRSLAIGWVPSEFCGQCGAHWHATAACPIDPNYVPDPAEVRRGSCCSPPPVE